MIGQKRLINHISSYSVDTFPKSVLIVGDEGCGKHTLVSEVIAPLLKLNVVDITKNVDFDFITDIAIRSEMNIYLINLDELTSIKQNVILKLLEEPPENAFLVLLTSASSKVLPTVLNRCQIFTFDDYTDEELLNFCNDPAVIRSVRSPGKLISIQNVDINYVENLCEKLFTMNKKASLANLLSVASKIDWLKKDGSLISVDIFIDVLVKTCSKLFKNKSISILEYKLTKDFASDVKSEIQFDRSRLFEKYLVELKYGM